MGSLALAPGLPGRGRGRGRSSPATAGQPGPRVSPAPVPSGPWERSPDPRLPSAPGRGASVSGPAGVPGRKGRRVRGPGLEGAGGTALRGDRVLRSGARCSGLFPRPARDTGPVSSLTLAGSCLFKQDLNFSYISHYKPQIIDFLPHAFEGRDLIPPYLPPPRCGSAVMATQWGAAIRTPVTLASSYKGRSGGFLTLG